MESKSLFAQIAAIALLSSTVSCKADMDANKHNDRSNGGYDADVPCKIIIDANIAAAGEFKGFGVEWDPHAEYRLSPSQWDTLISRVAFMKPQLVRCMVSTGWYFKGINENGEPIVNYCTPEFQAACRILDYCQKNNICVMWGDWGNPIKLDASSLNDTRWAKWAKITSDCLAYLINDRGYTCIKYYIPGNEPDGSWSSFKSSFDSYKTSVIAMNSELDSKKLASRVQLLGPDTFDNLKWINLTHDNLSKQIEAYDVHVYKFAADVKAGKIEKAFKRKIDEISTFDNVLPRRDLYITETGMLDGKTQSDTNPNVKLYWYGLYMGDMCAQFLRSGVSGAIAWDLDDSMHPTGPGPVYIHKTWGFWNSLGAELGNPEEVNLRPWFYSWSLFSRLFPSGSIVLTTNGADIDGFRVVAMKKLSGSISDMSFALVNNSGKKQRVKLQVPSANGTCTLKQFNYFTMDRPVDENGFPVAKQTIKGINLAEGVDIDLPADGIVFLTTLEGGVGLSLK